MKHLIESLVSNVGIGPHIANEQFFEKLARKRTVNKISYFKRFSEYIGIKEEDVLKVMKDIEQEALKHIGTQKEIITKGWIEWEWTSNLCWVTSGYCYQSKGGYPDVNYKHPGDDWFQADLDNKCIYIVDELHKYYDYKMNSIFKKYDIYKGGSGTLYRRYYIKDSIKDLTNI